MSRKPAKSAGRSVTVKQATLELLRAFGIRKVFGNPGSTELPFLSDWPDDIDYVLGLQEASVIGMADGYAQATRNAGFVNLHSAAGVGNALGNIYTAHRNQTPLVITAGQQARSILPLQPFLYAERAAEFPRPYVKFSVEPARAEDVPAAIARAYYMAMQPPCGPTFVSVPIDDWSRQTGPVLARRVSRELGPDAAAMQAFAAAIAASKRPAFVVGPAIDRAQAVELMVRVAEQAKAAVWVSPFSPRSSFPERHPQFAGFLHASPAQLSDALRDHDLVAVIGAPIFTFHVEGHASIFDGATNLFQITDDPTAATVTPVGTSIIATMTPALTMLLELLPETRRAMPRDGFCPPHPTRPIRSRLNSCCTPFRPQCPLTPCWWRKRRRTARRCKISCRCAARTVSAPWRAAASDLACPPRSAPRSAAPASGPFAWSATARRCIRSRRCGPRRNASCR